MIPSILGDVLPPAYASHYKPRLRRDLVRDMEESRAIFALACWIEWESDVDEPASQAWKRSSLHADDWYESIDLIGQEFVTLDVRDVAGIQRQVPQGGHYIIAAAAKG